MAANSDDFLEMLDEDDLIEIQVNSSRNPNSFGQLFLPNPSAPAIPSASTRPPRASRRSERRTQPPQGSQEPAPVIDLTEEPDSPIQSRSSMSQLHGGRNPRRTNSQRVSPPQLSRTDGTFVGRRASVIDLTVDSPEDERPSNHPGARAGRILPRPDELFELEVISQRQAVGPVGSFAFGPLRRLAGFFGTDIIFQPPQLDISRNAFTRQPSPKPAMEIPSRARDGFTRDTCTDPEKESESVVICPACSEELAYDPTGTVTQSSVGSTKGKRKRAPGEHHFWALKNCGHVYCADCYENRKPTKTNRDGVGFRSPDERHPYTAAADLRCAVEGCDTKVSAKNEWVGIFL
ncbi:hypothetical protein FSARC_10282 [Fusarium sarcochroum]|uniref:Cell cycle control protein n=1 Tax=Fusarium sarcochroum TaxID=1208366 RepID=A0A8H4TN40_9HYPO|nr:hypothetical protein FSARC_10282 [Fusarium sarcochroum]